MLPERAIDRLELVVENEGIIGWLKMPLFALLGYLGIEFYPKTIVRVRDRRTRRRLLSQTWTRPGETSRAIERFEQDLQHLTVDEFVAKWAPGPEPVRRMKPGWVAPGTSRPSSSSGEKTDRLSTRLI